MPRSLSLQWDFQLAPLKESQISEIRKLEERLNLCLLAVQKPIEYASLNDDQLSTLRSLERELGGIKLVAYK